MDDAGRSMETFSNYHLQHIIVLIDDSSSTHSLLQLSSSGWKDKPCGEVSSFLCSPSGYGDHPKLSQCEICSLAEKVALSIHSVLSWSMCITIITNLVLSLSVNYFLVLVLMVFVECILWHSKRCK